MKKPSSESYPVSYYRARAEALGYYLITNDKDYMGRKWKFHTAPMAAGSHGYCDSKADLDKYLSTVEKIRRWQEEDS